MKRGFNLIGVFIVMFFAASCATSDAEVASSEFDLQAPEVIARYFAARGGADRLRSLHIVERHGEMTVLMGDRMAKGPYRTCVIYGQAGAVYVDAGPVQVARAIVGADAWECDVQWSHCAPTRPPEAVNLAKTLVEASRELLFGGHQWAEFSVAGTDGVMVLGGGDSEPGFAVSFDAETGLMRSKEKPGRTRLYSDWRDVGGARFPFHLTDVSGGRPRSHIQLQSITANVPPSDWCQRVLGSVADKKP